MLFCNNKKNKLFKNINKNSKILGRHHVFCLNSKYPPRRAKSWLGWWGAHRAVGGRCLSQVAAGDVQTEEPAHSHLFQETKSTAIRWVLRELMKETEACVKAALRGRNAGALVP